MTRRLLDRYEIPTRTVSYHARSGPSRERELLAHLAGGADLALVTDAGTPVVSDPGRGPGRGVGGGRRGVVPIPGASSVLAAVAGVGRRGSALVVRGVPAAIGSRPPRAARADRRRRARDGAVRGAEPRRGHAPRPRRRLRRRSTGRRVPRADEAARADRSRVARRPRRARSPTARSRPAASSSSSSAWGIAAVTRSRRPSERGALARRARRGRRAWSPAGRPERGRRSTVVGRTTGLPRRDLYAATPRRRTAGDGAGGGSRAVAGRSVRVIRRPPRPPRGARPPRPRRRRRPGPR